MDIPVVSGLADNRVRELMISRFGGRSLPFMEATPQTLEQVLEELTIDPELRKVLAKRGRKHVGLFHSGAAVVDRAVSIYERLLRERQ